MRVLISGHAFFRDQAGLGIYFWKCKANERLITGEDEVMI